MKKAIKNQTTQKLELHFTKEDYQVLSADQKTSLKSCFLWSKSGACWVSRAKLDNCYHANKTAEKLGFNLTEAEIIGQRLSYAEELEIKTEKAEHREERYLQYAENAEHRAENLQKDIKDKRGDIAFFTQPILAGHAGSQTFARQREKMFSRYEKGFEEYRKSEYFREKALTAAGTASKQQLQNKTYLYNRIEEQKKTIKKITENIIWAEEHEREDLIEKYLQNYEYEADKQAFFENCLDELGGVCWSKENIKPGYLVKIRESWDLVVKANPKTVEAKSNYVNYTLNYPYAEIQEVKIPENWTDPAAKAIENPFSVDDILVWYHHADGNPYFKRAYQVIKTTQKQVTLKQLDYAENGIKLNNFKPGAKEMNRAFKQSDFWGNCVCVDDFILQKYLPAI